MNKSPQYNQQIERKQCKSRGRIHRFQKGVALYVGWLGNEENFRFHTFRNYKFLPKFFYQHFQSFSNFTYNQRLPMKSYQFLKIGKRFDKEKEKTLMQQSMRKEKKRKVGLCFVAGYLIKSFNMKLIIFFFLFLKLIRSSIFAF